MNIAIDWSTIQLIHHDSLVSALLPHTNHYPRLWRAVIVTTDLLHAKRFSILTIQVVKRSSSLVMYSPRCKITRRETALNLLVWPHVMSISFYVRSFLDAWTSEIYYVIIYSLVYLWSQVHAWCLFTSVMALRLGYSFDIMDKCIADNGPSKQVMSVNYWVGVQRRSGVFVGRW